MQLSSSGLPRGSNASAGDVFVEVWISSRLHEPVGLASELRAWFYAAHASSLAAALR